MFCPRSPRWQLSRAAIQRRASCPASRLCLAYFGGRSFSCADVLGASMRAAEPCINSFAVEDGSPQLGHASRNTRPNSAEWDFKDISDFFVGIVFQIKEVQRRLVWFLDLAEKL